MSKKWNTTWEGRGRWLWRVVDSWVPRIVYSDARTWVDPPARINVAYVYRRVTLRTADEWLITSANPSFVTRSCRLLSSSSPSIKHNMPFVWRRVTAASSVGGAGARRLMAVSICITNPTVTSCAQTRYRCLTIHSLSLSFSSLRRGSPLGFEPSQFVSLHFYICLT